MPINPDDLVNMREPNEQESESEGSAAEEAAESPEKEASEQGDEGAAVTPQFQKHAEAMMMSATKPELEYLKTQVEDKLKQMSHAQSKPEKAAMFDTEGMPT